MVVRRASEDGGVSGYAGPGFLNATGCHNMKP